MNQQELSRILCDLTAKLGMQLYADTNRLTGFIHDAIPDALTRNVLLAAVRYGVPSTLYNLSKTGALTAIEVRRLTAGFLGDTGVREDYGRIVVYCLSTALGFHDDTWTDITPVAAVRGNTGGNIANSGLAASHGDNVYLNDGNGLYRCTIDGASVARINDDVAYSIGVADGYIYYRNASDHGAIYRVRTDGSDRVRLCDDNAWFITVADGYVYYQNDSDNKRLYRMRTDGEQRLCLSEDGASFINVSDSWVYYNDNFMGNGNIYKVTVDGAHRTRVCADSGLFLNVVGDWIYYQNNSDNGYLYKIRTDGTQRTLIQKDSCIYVNVSGDWIYYKNTSDNAFYRIDIEGVNRHKLCDDDARFVSVIGEWLYSRNHSHNHRLYRIHIDGARRAPVMDANGTSAQSDGTRTKPRGKQLGYALPYMPYAERRDGYKKHSRSGVLWRRFWRGIPPIWWFGTSFGFYAGLCAAVLFGIHALTLFYFTALGVVASYAAAYGYHAGKRRFTHKWAGTISYLFVFYSLYLVLFMSLTGVVFNRHIVSYIEHNHWSTGTTPDIPFRFAHSHVLFNYRSDDGKLWSYDTPMLMGNATVSYELPFAYENRKRNANIAVHGIVLERKTMTLRAGEQWRIPYAAIYDAENERIRWSSDMPNIAIVDQTGNVRAIANGSDAQQSCTISATLPCGATDSVTILINTE